MKYWFLALLFLTVSACRPPAEQAALSDEQIARLMADFYVAEAATNGLSGYPKDSLTQVYYIQVLEQHGVSLAEYEKSLRILAADVPRMKAVQVRANAILEPGKKTGGQQVETGEPK